jgi:tripartite-type tricarboxylate transporter receptor subunit TctC
VGSFRHADRNPAGDRRQTRDGAKEIAGEQSMQSRFLVAGARLFSSTPAEAAAFAAKETVMWREVVRLSGLTPQ